MSKNQKPESKTLSATSFLGGSHDRAIAYSAFWLGFAAGGLLAFCLSALALSY